MFGLVDGYLQVCCRGLQRFCGAFKCACTGGCLGSVLEGDKNIDSS